MLYTFGDSMTFGWNLYKAMSEEDRQALAWPGVLSRMLDVPVKDFSFPGASNWKPARVLQSLPLTEQDIVVIQWSAFDRIEIGVNETYEYNSTTPDNAKYKIVDSIQNEDGMITKNICRTLIPHTTDQTTKKFMFHMYKTFWNEKWHREMFKVMLTSCCYRLEKSKCKYIMFDGWMQHCDDDLFRDIPNYIVRGTTMNNITKNISGVVTNDLDYGGPDQNRIIAETVYKNLEKIYGL